MRALSYSIALLSVMLLTNCAKVPKAPDDPTRLGLIPESTHYAGQDIKTYSVEKIPAKPTIIFVHGSPGRAFNWLEYLTDEELKAQFNLLAYDRPGFAETGKPHRLLSDQIEVLVALIEKETGPVILVGHSLGGAVVAGAASEYTERPDKIRHVLVLAGSVDPNLGRTKALNTLVKYTPIRWVISGDLNSSNEEVYALKKELIKLQPRLSKVRAPVTIIQGEKDFLVPAGNVTYLQEQLTGAEVNEIMLPKEGHFLPWRQFPLIKRTLLRFSDPESQ